MNRELAPIVLFVYNRPSHALSTLSALSSNFYADQSTLFIYADGPKDNASPADVIRIEEVSKIAKGKKWCKENHFIKRERNIGLAANIVSGVTDILNEYGKVIVLEDDIVTSVGFLKYMNAALRIYNTDDKVMHVSSFIYPIETCGLDDTFFYNVNSCWGWGTWKRAWDDFISDPHILLMNLKQKGYDKVKFNGGQAEEFYNQLLANENGTLNTWAIKWHTSIFLKDGLCLHPRSSLIHNIGFDQSATHTKGKNDKLIIASNNIQVKRQPLFEEPRVPLLIQQYFEKEKRIQNRPTIMFIKKVYHFMKLGIKKTLNLLIDPYNRELSRLKKMPRYLAGSSSILGVKFYFVDVVTFLVGCQEIFKNSVYEFKTGIQDPVIIDCGANIGLSVYYFKTLYPKARIKAFEPDPDIFKVLRQNVRDLNLVDIELFQEAVWKENGSVTFHPEGGFSGRIPKEGDVNKLVTVPCRRLKDLLQEKIHFLKIDIEGAEFEVISDIRRELVNVENIFIEYHSHVSEDQTLPVILQILKDAGFRIHIQEAFVRRKPFVDKETLLGMDLQLNVYGVRNY